MEETYLTLSLAGVSSKKQLSLIEKFGDSEKLWRKLKSPPQLSPILNDSEINAITEIMNGTALKDFMFGLEKTGIGFVTIESPNYSQKLSQIFDPPTVLYYRGDPQLLQQLSIAIVGSRTCTRYGAEQTTRFAKQLALSGLAVVSGLAEGIDGHAHRGALEAKGKTIAVLAGGLNNIYPAIHVKLAKEIEEKGLLVSENIPNFTPKGFNFVQRNRIIAGLSDGVFLPEASEKSGALHTINFANDFGRQVFVLPGAVSSPKSAGTNNLIKNLQGSCVTEPNDIIRQFPGLQAERKSRKIVQMTVDETLVFNALKNEELHYDEILEKTKLDEKTLNSLLTLMEIRGLIKRLPSNFFAAAD